MEQTQKQYEELMEQLKSETDDEKALQDATKKLEEEIANLQTLIGEQPANWETSTDNATAAIQKEIEAIEGKDREAQQSRRFVQRDANSLGNLRQHFAEICDRVETTKANQLRERKEHVESLRKQLEELSLQPEAPQERMEAIMAEVAEMPQSLEEVTALQSEVEHVKLQFKQRREHLRKMEEINGQADEQKRQLEALLDEAATLLNDAAAIPQTYEGTASRLTAQIAQAEELRPSVEGELSSQLDGVLAKARELDASMQKRWSLWLEFLAQRDKANALLEAARSPLEAIEGKPLRSAEEALEDLRQLKVSYQFAFEVC
jgi:chromosome segregation ATPase